MTDNEAKFVQITLTAQQAWLLGVAADNGASTKGISQQAKDNLERLSVFFYDVASDPESYPVRGEAARATVKTLVQRAKGPAQTQSRVNKRKARQAERMSFHKHRRRNRQAVAKLYNEKVAELIAEARAAEGAKASKTDALKNLIRPRRNRLEIEEQPYVHRSYGG